MKFYDVIWRDIYLNTTFFMYDICRLIGRMTKNYTVYRRTVEWRILWYNRGIQQYIKLYGYDPCCE